MVLSVVTMSGWREEAADISAVTAGGWRQESVPDLGGGGVGDEGITVTSFAARRVWEGASGAGLVTITGTHTGITDTIEVQIEDTSAGVVVAWTALHASVAEGVYSGQVSVPRGGWYRARVRKASDAGISALQTTDWGVGYIIGGFGQSQLVNFSGSGSGTPNDRAVTFDGSTWTPLTADGAGRNAFANALIGVADCPVAMIFSAASGVEISRWWAAGKTSHYTAWESIVSAAGGDLSAFLLWQGEGDANIYRSKAAYKADIDAIFAQLRSDIYATLPVVIVNLGRLTGTSLDDNAYEQIRDAHVEAAASLNNQGVVTYDLPLSDSAHINATGQVVVGNRLAQCMAHAYALASYSQGPRVASVAATSSTVVDVVIEHDGGTDFTPTTGITGFSVLDGGTPVSISTVERLSASAVRITLAAPLVGAVSVRYGYGRNPDISGVLKDNSILSLPMVTTDVDTLEAAAILPIAPAAGRASARGYAPSIAQPITLAPIAGRAAATGYAPTLTQPRTIAPTKGSAQARGYAPTIEQSAAQTIAPASGRAEARGYAPALSQPITLTPAAGHAIARGYATEISQASSIRPETGRVHARGYAPTIAQPRTIAAQTGRAQASGHGPIIVQGSPIVIDPQTGRVSARGYAPGVEQGGARTVSPAAGHVWARGLVPSVTTTPIGGYPSSVTISVPSGRTITLRPR